MKSSSASLKLATEQQRKEESNNNNKIIISSSSPQQQHHRLPKLLSQQRESTKDGNVDQLEPLNESKALTSTASETDCTEKGNESEGAEIEMKEIIRELRIVRRQNAITHWLLSVLIFVTGVWQMSEVSILLYVKNSVKHRFRAIGTLLTGSLGRSNEQAQSDIAGPHLPHQIRIPELPSVELPSLGLNIMSDDDK